MRTFNLYIAGFPMATFQLDETNPTHIIYKDRLNPKNVWGDFQLLKPEAPYHLGRFLPLLMSWLQQEAFFQNLCNHPDLTGKTPWGGRYSQKNDYYWYERFETFAKDIIFTNNRLVGMQMISIDTTLVLVEPGFEKFTVLKDWQAQNLKSQPSSTFKQTTDFVPMTDGVKLATEVFFPKEAQIKSVSTILIRTAYNRQLSYEQYRAFVRHGYAVVIQDVRGRNDSEGIFEPFRNEAQDGKDTLDWIAKQPWSNEKVGMIGGSYMGFTQYAAASTGDTHLKAMVTMVPAGGPFNDNIRRGGTWLQILVPILFGWAKKKFDPALMVQKNWPALMSIRPLQAIAVKALGKPMKFYDEILKHDADDGFYMPMNWFAHKDNIQAPVFIQGGWFDDLGNGTTEAIRATDDYPKGQRKIIIGPWLHNGNSQYDLGKEKLGAHALRADLELQHLLWLNHFLNGDDNHVNEGPVAEYYELNSDKWLTADELPLTRNATTLYLNAQDQSLSEKAPQQTGAISYQYDPKHPVPFLGDISNMADLTDSDYGFASDYSKLEQRPDVLTFTTKPFNKTEHLSGLFTVGFYAASSVVDTDWVGRLTDVTPNGESIVLADGMLNARFRKHDFTHPEFMEPGKKYLFEFETTKIATAIPKGHALRLEITSSAFGFIFPNSNTKAGVNTYKSVIATQTIYTGGPTPSYVKIPLRNR